MVSLEQLWMPVLMSAVLVFVASSLIHMVLKWHNSDYHKLANEDDVRNAIRASNPAPGLYVLPYCMGPQDFKQPGMMEKFKEGPVGFVTLRTAGAPNMGPTLGQWFVLNVLVAVVVAYLVSRTVPADASFLAVCRVVGLVTFLSYATGGVVNAIWMGKAWGSAMKEGLDAFIYGLVSAVSFGWLWPR